MQKVQYYKTIMQVLSDSECASWLSTHGYEFQDVNRAEGLEGYICLPASHYRSVFKMPVSADARTQLFLSRRLAQWIQSSDVMLWITSWAVYTPEEMDVFVDLRQGFGEQRRLVDAPGHLFHTGDAEELRHTASILLLMMAFNWEGFVVSSDAQSILWMADEMLETSTNNQAEDTRLLVSLEQLGITKLS
jgi:hypothetical protein